MNSLLSQNAIRTGMLVLLLASVQWLMIEAKLSACSKATEGNYTLYRKSSGDDRVVICLKNNGKYMWQFLDGSPTLGEHFNPAEDCSDIVDNLPRAKDGFYWIKHSMGKLSKGWCNTHTDNGGFLLVGMNDSPMIWNLPSNEKPVDPLGPLHWSSEFGDINVQDFAIQISTTKDFEDTRAHWLYRLKIDRPLGNLFGVGSGGCTDFHSGIGNVSYVKDILTETVVTTNFSCSKFGPHTNVNLGWGRMNYCLRKKCPKGYAFIKGFPFRLDSHGSFSYSASSKFSGITHDATAFVGCDSVKCCACFGPKGGRDHYCDRKCKAINGGTILKGKVYIWYWIRTRMPKRLWNRCMDFKMKTEAGKLKTYYIDGNLGTTHEGTCSEQFHTLLNEGTLSVKNKESFTNLPSVAGLLSYCEENKKLYVNNGNNWDAIGSQKQIDNLAKRVEQLERRTDIDDCARKPCLNGAQCVDKVNSYQCICKTGYKGVNCETMTKLSVQLKSYGCNDVGRWLHRNCKTAIASIKVNGREYAKNTRGYNMAVFDNKGSFIESKVFDTHASTLSVTNMKNYIKNIPDGRIVLVAIKDEGSKNMKKSDYEYLKEIGAQDPIISEFRGSFTLAGYSGPGRRSYMCQVQRGSGKGPSLLNVNIPLPVPSGP